MAMASPRSRDPIDPWAPRRSRDRAPSTFRWGFFVLGLCAGIAVVALTIVAYAAFARTLPWLLTVIPVVGVVVAFVCTVRFSTRVFGVGMLTIVGLVAAAFVFLAVSYEYSGGG